MVGGIHSIIYYVSDSEKLSICYNLLIGNETDPAWKKNKPSF